jgi:hypothetical protein|tara:strand:+ start:23 stop:595 length:573 start_codon:yes stop_codon:yes gene_type:complete
MLDEEILATVRTNPDKPASVNVLRKRFNVGWGRAKRLFKLYRAEELGCAPSDVPILPPGARPQGDSGRRLVKKRKSRETYPDEREKGKRRQSTHKKANNSPQLTLQQEDFRAEKIASILTPNTLFYFLGKNNHVLAEGLPEIMKAKEALMQQQQVQNQLPIRHGAGSSGRGNPYVGGVTMKHVSHSLLHH